MRAMQEAVLEKSAIAFHQGTCLERARSEYEKLAMLIARIKHDLHNTESFARKDKIKKDHLYYFLPWIKGVLQTTPEKGKGKQDMILVQWLIWSLDIGDLDLAQHIARYCIRFDLVLPMGFERTLPTFYLDTLAKLAKKARDLGKPFKLGYLKNAITMTRNCDVNEYTQAKVWREIGLRQLARQSKCAVASLNRAFELDTNCGVRSILRKLTKTPAKVAKRPRLKKPSA